MVLVRWNELAIIPTIVQQRLPGIGPGGGEESGWHSKTSLESLSEGASATALFQPQGGVEGACRSQTSTRAGADGTGVRSRIA